MKVGYVRVSTTEQNTARQELLMKELGVDRVFTDKLSGKDRNRDELMKMMGFVRAGDTVIVESISRFARNTKDLLVLVEELQKKQVLFISQKESIDTSSTMGRFVLTIFGAIAELEREYILDRQREGIVIAKEQGKYKGRQEKKLDDFEEIYENWKKGLITAKKASETLGVSRSTFYRRVEKLEKKDLQ